MLRLVVGFLLALAAAAMAQASELETTHLFGFTLGSDVNAIGEKEAESETTGRFGKGGGSYSAISHALGVKFAPFQDFSVEPVVTLDYHSIAAVPGLDDRKQFAYGETSVELRYRLLNRDKAPIGLTVGLDPHWARVDDISALPVDRYGATFLLIADKALVEDKIFAAVNFIYEPNATRSRTAGDWQHDSSVGVSAAVSGQIRPGVLIGAEARTMRSFDGLGLDKLTGNALFVGPTFYAKFSEQIWMSAAWSVQVTGHAVNESAPLDLTNFERQQAVLRFGYNF